MEAPRSHRRAQHHFDDARRQTAHFVHYRAQVAVELRQEFRIVQHR
jgi:hypothetical protein